MDRPPDPIFTEKIGLDAPSGHHMVEISATRTNLSAAVTEHPEDKIDTIDMLTCIRQALLDAANLSSTIFQKTVVHPENISASSIDGKLVYVAKLSFNNWSFTATFILSFDPNLGAWRFDASAVPVMSDRIMALKVNTAMSLYMVQILDGTITQMITKRDAGET